MKLTLNVSAVDNLALRRMPMPRETEDVLHCECSNGSMIEILVASCWDKEKLRGLLGLICEDLDISIEREKRRISEMKR